MESDPVFESVEQYKNFVNTHDPTIFIMSNFTTRVYEREDQNNIIVKQRGNKYDNDLFIYEIESMEIIGSEFERVNDIDSIDHLLEDTEDAITGKRRQGLDIRQIAFNIFKVTLYDSKSSFRVKIKLKGQMYMREDQK